MDRKSKFRDLHLEGYVDGILKKEKEKKQKREGV